LTEYGYRLLVFYRYNVPWVRPFGMDCLHVVRFRGRARATHPARPASYREAGLLAAFLLMGCGASTGLPEPKSKLWRGLAVAPEARCAPYSRDDYRYPASVEAEIIAAMGGRIYGPYTGRYFGSPAETDIEHIVAVSEAHDSGMCA